MHAFQNEKGLMYYELFSTVAWRLPVFSSTVAEVHFILSYEQTLTLSSEAACVLFNQATVKIHL